METKTVFFIGKPGCGKGTQAKLLSEKTGWQVISSGSQFRAIGAEDTSVGRKVRLEVDAGLLSPHWFAMYLYLKALFNLPEGSGVIFDGFNRKVPEAELVIDSLKWLERPFVIFNIIVSDDVVRHRLELRKQTSGRADDSAVDERMKEYEQFTKPAIEIFRSSGTLIEINGEQGLEAIAEDIYNALAAHSA